MYQHTVTCTSLHVQAAQVELISTVQCYAGGARVIQVGGGSRDLYYYPKDTIAVTAISPKLKKGKGPLASCNRLVEIACMVWLSQRASRPHCSKMVFFP